jgi:hypothetical protein
MMMTSQDQPSENGANPVVKWTKTKKQSKTKLLSQSLAATARTTLDRHGHEREDHNANL